MLVPVQIATSLPASASGRSFTVNVITLELSSLQSVPPHTNLALYWYVPAVKPASVVYVFPVATFVHEPDVPALNCHCTSLQSRPPVGVAVKLAVSPSQTASSSILIVTSGSSTTFIVTTFELSLSQPVPLQMY